MTVTITNEDYGPEDWDTVVMTGAEFMGVLGDIAFHNIGDGWDPHAKPGDVAGLVEEVRGLVDRMEEAAQVARRGLARAERVARLHASNRGRSATP